MGERTWSVCSWHNETHIVRMEAEEKKKGMLRENDNPCVGMGWPFSRLFRLAGYDMGHLSGCEAGLTLGGRQ
jgi:hypothetical protein